ncbi:hypothetical protein D9757_009303 [Collybiopsis confluens]|uniref:Uncharacterized protein n=1 Tax=Collybiopsis confluens TaxID=2823264 RepID=A0A8H5H4B8_9AGAR|nr:hypothetical protein D9757_009303 [Collybiopsis confluens]
MKRKSSALHKQRDKKERIRSSPDATPPSPAQSLTAFSSLLNFAGEENLEARFDEIAEQLFQHLVISVKEGSATVAVFEILELEFYFWNIGVHEDPFTHRAAEQAHSGNWYFHRVPQKSDSSTSSVGNGYRGGTRKGLDLTIGQAATTTTSPYFTFASPSKDIPPSSTRGGVLLRTLRNTSTEKVISGPSLLVDEILKLSQASKISELVDERWMGDTSAFRDKSASGTSDAARNSMLCIDMRSTAQAEVPVIHRSPRIGLDPSHSTISLTPTHPRAVFSTKPYRYFIHPNLLTANGRPQTFLGVLASLKPIFPAQGAARDEKELERLKNGVSRQSGMSSQTVAKYLEHYVAGLEVRILMDSDPDFFARATKKQASSSPATYLRLMGMLSAVG